MDKLLSTAKKIQTTRLLAGHRSSLQDALVAAAVCRRYGLPLPDPQEGPTYIATDRLGQRIGSQPGEKIDIFIEGWCHHQIVDLLFWSRSDWYFPLPDEFVFTVPPGTDLSSKDPVDRRRCTCGHPIAEWTYDYAAWKCYRCLGYRRNDLDAEFIESEDRRLFPNTPWLPPRTSRPNQGRSKPEGGSESVLREQAGERGTATESPGLFEDRGGAGDDTG